MITFLRRMGNMRFYKEMEISGRSKIVLDPGDTKINYFNDSDALLKFNVETFNVLKYKSSQEQWDVVFKDIEYILNNLVNEEFRIAYADFLQAAHYKIKEAIDVNSAIDDKKIIKLESDLSEMLYRFNEDFKVLNILEDYAENYLPIQNFQGVGERAQDSEEMTFYRDDVIKVSAEALLSKLICPILGVFLECCKKRIDNTIKETHALAIFKKIYETNYLNIILKQNNFIYKIIKRIINTSKLNHLINGYTKESICVNILASIIVRRMVAVNLHEPNGNLITYITSCARAAAQTQFSNTGFKISAAEYLKPSEKDQTEDGNTSNLEAESRISAKTADFNIIIEAGIQQLIKKFTVEHGLDMEVLESAYYFYQTNHITLTPANSYLMSILFHSYLCGAKTIEYISGPNLIKLICILQLYLIEQGYPDLVHLVSAKPTNKAKVVLSNAELQLRNTWNNSLEYKNCNDKLQFMHNDVKWDTSLDNIVKTYTGQKFIINTAPEIWDTLNQEVCNGYEFILPDTSPRSICSIINASIM